MLKTELHLKFIEKIINKKDLDFYLTEPNRMYTIYWTINSLRLLNDDTIFYGIKEKAIDFVLSCLNKDGGFGGSVGYSSNIYNTLAALQILYIYNYKFENESTIHFIIDNYCESDGSYKNDKYGESDARMVCCAVLSLHLMYILSRGEFERSLLEKPLDKSYIDKYGIEVDKTVMYILSCYNRDGGFGAIPGAESHSAFTFCCISALRTLGCLDGIPKDDISQFIAMRQDTSGGLSGRINKKVDVCYSFWSFASMLMIGRKDLISKKMLSEYIYKCQGKNGGFSDRPGNEPDVYHLMFSLSALSLLDLNEEVFLDPGFAL